MRREACIVLETTIFLETAHFFFGNQYETEGALRLVVGNHLLNLAHNRIHRPHIIQLTSQKQYLK